jgi:hypothetical protein
MAYGSYAAGASVVRINLQRRLIAKKPHQLASARKNLRS